MPHRIICACIVQDVKPYQLVAALMHAQGLGPLPLAKRLGKPKLQPPIHRFINGDVANPEITTAKPIADYFSLPLEALYDEKVATEIAAQRGVKELPARTAKSKDKPEAAEEFDDDVKKFAARYAKMSATERQRLRLLMHVAREGVQPPFKAATGEPAPPQADPAEEGSSDLGELDRIARAAKRGRLPRGISILGDLDEGQTAAKPTGTGGKKK